MIVVIEGCDNVGKTSVAKYLEENLNDAVVQHFANPKSSERYVTQINHFMTEVKAAGSDIIICDRSWIGESAYAPVMRDYENTHEYWATRQIAKLGQRVLLILLYCPRKKALSFPVSSQQDRLALREANYESLQTLFIEYFKRHKMFDKVIFNIDNFKSLQDEQAYILKFVNNWIQYLILYKPFVDDYQQTMFNPSFRFIDGIMPVDKTCSCIHANDHKLYSFYRDFKSITWGAGSLKPKVIFIGEAPGMYGCGRTGLPFYGDKSGMLFRQWLFERKISEVEYYMTNVVKCTPKDNKLNPDCIDDCSVHLNHELNAIESYCDGELPPIISVGRTADSWLTKNELPHRHIRHPAYVLYRANEEDEYKKDLDYVLKQVGLLA